MTKNEQELIDIIRTSKDPELAMQIATEIILNHLVQREYSQSQSAALPPEPYAAT
jgi:hypothetical protein